MIRRMIFWSSVTAVVYSYVGFPLVVLLRGRFRRRPWCAASASVPAPSVSVVIAAHNEGRAIGGKVRTVIDQDYDGPLECIVVSDGSEDDTVEQARAVGGDRVTVLDGARTGKAGALNAGIAEATGDIIVFTDANSRLPPDCISQLVRPFADAEVGGVAGDQRYEGGDGSAAGERTYWELDRVMKIAESDAGNVISATGALYAVRADLVISVPDGVTDDFAVSTGVIEQGRRLVFAPDAVAYEPPAVAVADEFARKVRVMTRGLRGVMLRRRLLDPRRHGFYAFQLFSHKVLRRLSVVPLLVAYLTSLTLARRRNYRLVAATGTAFGAAVAVSAAATRTRWASNRFVAVLSYYGMANAAALRAIWNVVTGRRIDRWTPRRTGSE